MGVVTFRGPLGVRGGGESVLLQLQFVASRGRAGGASESMESSNLCFSLFCQLQYRAQQFLRPHKSSNLRPIKVLLNIKN